MSSKLFVGNLDFSVGEADLREAFEPFGALVSVSLITDRETGRPRGFGFVEYESADSAQQAIATLDGTAIRGRNVNVSQARERAGAPSQRTRRW